MTAPERERIQQNILKDIAMSAGGYGNYQDVRIVWEALEEARAENTRLRERIRDLESLILILQTATHKS